MDFLVTSSRLPFALEEIRKLGRCGHRVYASDAFFTAPGNHSKYVARAFVTAPPRYESARFLDDLEEIVREHAIDLVLPSFEEIFYLAQEKARFERFTEIFAPPFATLRRLHDKTSFLALGSDLGLPVPPTVVAQSREELALAARELGTFFARPAFTRGGVTLCTNAGPLAGKVPFDECAPSAENPFLVQPFLEGTDVCTFSVAHHGKITAHVAYEHPLRLEHAGGIVFESIDARSTLSLVSRVVEATGYHGQISFDFLRTERGLVAIECNPRPSAGLVVMPDEMLLEALLDREGREVRLAPAGTRRKLSLALLRNALIRPREARASLRALFTKMPDIYADPRDPMPLFFQLLAYSHVLAYRFRRGRVHRTDLMEGYFHDLCWNGERIGAAQSAPASSRAISGLSSSQIMER